jgi:membrane-bound lytic murein transglycosylase F
VLFISCSSEKENRTEVEVPPTKQVELPPTQTPGKLVALLENSVTSYYINKGYPRGFEYEMLSLFCKDHDLELDIRMVHNMDQLFDSLTDGSADILAANITVTGERKNFVSFSNPILRTRQVLIQRLPEGYKRMSSSKIKKRIVNDALDLEGRTVHVHNNTSYMTQLKNYVNSNGMNVNIVAIDPEEGIDDLIAEVAEGKYDFTILDENIASIYKKIYPNLHISIPISLSQNIAWAVKKDNARLLEMINQWQEENRGSTRWNMIYNKYFKYTSSEVKYLQNHISDLKTGELTPYDPLIQKYANQIEWDWRL